MQLNKRGWRAHISTTRYLHVLQPGVDAAIAGRRGSMPTVSSSSVAYAPPGRRGSEPALLQAEVMSRQQCSRSGLVVNVSNPQHNIGRLAADIAEEQSQGIECFHGWHWLLLSISPYLTYLFFFFFYLQILALISLLLGNRSRAQKLLKHVMEEMSRFAYFFKCDLSTGHTGD